MQTLEQTYISVEWIPNELLNRTKRARTHPSSEGLPVSLLICKSLTSSSF